MIFPWDGFLQTVDPGSTEAIGVIAVTPDHAAPVMLFRHPAAVIQNIKV